MGAMTAPTEPAGLPPGPLTVDDLEAMPDDGHRYELLDGVLIVSPAPRPLHQRMAFRLAMLLDGLAPPGPSRSRSRRLPCCAEAGETGTRMAERTGGHGCAPTATCGIVAAVMRASTIAARAIIIGRRVGTA